MGFVFWIGWNVFLAAIPVLFAFIAAGIAGRMRSRKDPRWWWLLAPALLGWLIFLPNACYLFTELRHVLAAVDRHELWSRARSDHRALEQLAVWTAVGVVNVVAGALTFGLAIRPLRRIVPWRPGAYPVVAYAFFCVMAVGVYLGLIVRYNSWDLFTRPQAVLRTAAGLAERPLLFAALLLLGLALWVTYEAIDIWFDGVAARLKPTCRPAQAPAAQ